MSKTCQSLMKIVVPPEETTATTSETVDKENQTTPFTITSKDVHNCAHQREGKVSVFGESGTVALSNTANSTAKKEDGGLEDDQNTNSHWAVNGRIKCTIEITIPQGKVFRVRAKQWDPDCGVNVKIVEPGVTPLTLARLCGDRVPRDVYTHSHRVHMILDAKDPGAFRSSALWVELLALPRSQRPQLEVKFVSTGRGYIQSPGWNEGKAFPTDMNSQVHIDIQPQHTLMLSGTSLPTNRSDNCKATLVVYDSVFPGRNHVFHPCDVFVDSPRLFTGTFYAHFKSDHVQNRAVRFRLRFSIHNTSSLLQEVQFGLWNCSVPQWAEYRDHFPCNLRSDCVYSEDEAGCPYTSERCGPGFFLLEGACVEFASPTSSVSWVMASERCVARGGTLAVLNTVSKWDTVTTLMADYLGSRARRSWHIGLLQEVDSTKMWPYGEADVWTDGSVAYYTERETSFHSQYERTRCYLLLTSGRVQEHACSFKSKDYLCEHSPLGDRLPPMQGIALTRSMDLPNFVSTVGCPGRHFTFQFLACDRKTRCWARASASRDCRAPLTPLPPMFTCTNQLEDVPYSLVCDFRSDCGDGSDEEFCVFAPCQPMKQYQCRNKQCIGKKQHCDWVQNCADGSDEVECLDSSPMFTINPVKGPALVDFDGRGAFRVSRLNATVNSNATRPHLNDSRVEYQLYDNATQPEPYATLAGYDSNFSSALCPEAYFQCRSGLHYCLPVYVRCNGVRDCPGNEDEADCGTSTCPGFYRCRGSHICLHPDHLCDGWPQCPQHDDETVCSFPPCPTHCTCYGLAWFCAERLSEVGPDVRFLDVEGTGTTLFRFGGARMLVYLGLSLCGIHDLTRTPQLPNLLTLQLSHNRLTSLAFDDLANLTNLRVLQLSGNPLVSIAAKQNFSLPSLWSLDLSGSRLRYLDTVALQVFPNLKNLNLSNSSVELIGQEGFRRHDQLRVLDLRRSPLREFPKTIFYGLHELSFVYSDNYKLCCEETLPEGFNPANCHSPSDEITSCANLLRSDVYRVTLAVFAVLSLLGNLTSFIYRLRYEKAARKQSYGAFVIHLAVSDFVMGVYLAMIGLADQHYRSVYLWQDLTWKSSTLCSLAGFLSLLSNEVSAFLICLITLDRFLVIRFPFSHVRFSSVTAHVTCGLVWLVGAVLALVPLLPVTSHWRFYSQSDICLPLPVTRRSFPGHSYSFSVMIVVNFVLFLLIAVGQVFIYQSVAASRMPTSISTTTSASSRDRTVARRLITIALSDFLCWFPIGLLGLLASRGVAIPGGVNVAVAIFVLPLNSAINPFLYTLNILLERRQQVTQDRLLEQIKGQMASEMQEAEVKARAVNSEGEARELVRFWLSAGLTTEGRLAALLKEAQPRHGQSEEIR